MKTYLSRPLLPALLLFLFLVGCAAQQQIQTVPPETVRQFALNDITVLELVDSPLTFEASMWPDIANYPDRLAMMPDGTFETVIKTFVVKTGGRTVLIDGGVGQEHYVTKGDTVALLKTSGIAPEAVTDILMTHLDVDHVAGLVSGLNAVYPNARLHVSRPEYDAWAKDSGLVNRMPEHKNLTRNIVLPAYADRLQLFNFGDTVVPGIVAVDAVGHTPGHTAFEITSGNRGMLVAGDFMHVAPIQLVTPEYSTVWDAQPQAGQTRKRLLERLADSNIMLAGMHLADIGHVRRMPSGEFIIAPVQ